MNTKGRVPHRRVLTGFAFALVLLLGGTRAQAAEELSMAMRGELMGFVQNAYFNANRLGEMPKFPTDRPATQAEVLDAVASALRIRQHSCASVTGADYADDSGDILTIHCADKNYTVEAKSGKITP